MLVIASSILLGFGVAFLVIALLQIIAREALQCRASHEDYDNMTASATIAFTGGCLFILAWLMTR